MRTAWTRQMTERRSALYRGRDRDWDRRDHSRETAVRARTRNVALHAGRRVREVREMDDGNHVLEGGTGSATGLQRGMGEVCHRRLLRDSHLLRPGRGV